MAFVVYIYGGKRMQNLLLVLGDAGVECLDKPLANFPELQIETVHPDCRKSDTLDQLRIQLDEILTRRTEELRYAIFHKSVGGNRKGYSSGELVELDKMDIEIFKTFESCGFIVIAIDAEDGSCSTQFSQCISQILSSQGGK
jgi:hypothetical protein